MDGNEDGGHPLPSLDVGDHIAFQREMMTLTRLKSRIVGICQAFWSQPLKRITAVALAGWAAIAAISWALANARIEVCQRASGYTAEANCIVRATAARDYVLSAGLTVGLMIFVAALIVSSLVRPCRNGRGLDQSFGMAQPKPGAQKSVIQLPAPTSAESPVQARQVPKSRRYWRTKAIYIGVFGFGGLQVYRTLHPNPYNLQWVADVRYHPAAPVIGAMTPVLLGAPLLYWILGKVAPKSWR